MRVSAGIGDDEASPEAEAGLEAEVSVLALGLIFPLANCPLRIK